MEERHDRRRLARHRHPPHAGDPCCRPCDGGYVVFPDTPIAFAHPSLPRTEEGPLVAQHKPDVYTDMSGWNSKCLPPLCVHDANTILRRKMLFGSDRPAITPDRRLKDLAEIDIHDAVRPMILRDRARRLLGI